MPLHSVQRVAVGLAEGPRCGLVFPVPPQWRRGCPAPCPEYWCWRGAVAIRPCRPSTFGYERLSRST